MKNLLKKLFFPAVFAFIFLFLIILLYPLPFNHPYGLFLLERKDYPSLFEYYDMDSDGESELLYTGYNNPENNTYPFVRIMKKHTRHEQVLEQINLVNNKLPLRAATRAGDFDNDGLLEFYVFTLNDAVLFLEAFEFQPDLSAIQPFLYREIVPVNIYKDEFDVAIYTDLDLADVNHDGYREFIFIVNGLFTAEPRGTFIYDIHHDSLWNSTTQAMAMTRMQMLAHGGKTYFGFLTTNPHNQDPPLAEYHDHCGWAMLLDEDLEMLFMPDSGNIGYDHPVQTFPIIWKGQIHALAFFHVPAGSREHPEIRVYDEHGAVIMRREVETYGRHFINEIDTKEGTFTFGPFDSDIAWRCRVADDIELEPIPKAAARCLTTTLYYPCTRTGWDVDVGINQNDGTVLLLSDRLRPYTSIKAIEKSGYYQFSFGKNDGAEVLAITSFQNSIFVGVKPNKGYPIRWIYRSGIFLALLAFFGFTQWIFNLQLRRQQRLRESLTQSQLALSKRQLEPHFMLNTLNNIGYLFTHNERKEAQYYFGKYASLLRRGLMLADRVETTLEEELEFIRDYLVLQKQRFNGDLDYHIDVNEAIKPADINIPHSLIYTFVENAIKHGLHPKEEDRRLWITVQRFDNQEVIIIRDNGIGREKAREFKTQGTQQGTHIVDSILDGYNRLYKRQVSYAIKDLYNDDGSASGTEVKVVVG